MVTVYFLHGHVIAMHPAPEKTYYDSRQQIYNCDIIISDGKRYDLQDKSQIYAIEIPDYKAADKEHRVVNELGSTGYLEYVLRMKASQYKNLGNDALAYACLGQATKLMLYSDLGWQEKDFWRIHEWLEKDGKFNLADRWEVWIKENVLTQADETFLHFQETLKTCDEIGTGLVLIPWADAQSGAVAKYQGRVYSLPGIKSKFPILPTFIMERGCIIPPFGGNLIPFTLWNDSTLDTIWYKNKDCSALRTSWRPFVDDRSPEEKKNYYDRQYKILEKEHKENNRRLYLHLRYAFPDLCPDRLNTFYSWERTHPDKHEQIVTAALKAGLDVPAKEFQMPRDYEPSDPDPTYHGGRLRPLFML